MQGDESIALPIGRKLPAGVERNAKRRRVRLDQNVGHGDLVGKVRPPPATGTGVLMIADIVPRPAVERPLLDAGDVIGREIVAQ